MGLYVGQGHPLLHIADPAADATNAQNLSLSGLLGMPFTMEQDFFAGGSKMSTGWTR